MSIVLIIFVYVQEWFAVYVELNQQIAALLSAGEEEEVVELKALQQQLSDVCYRQAAQLEGRQNVLQAAQGFHSTTQEVTHTHTHSLHQLLFVQDDLRLWFHLCASSTESRTCLA